MTEVWLRSNRRILLLTMALVGCGGGLAAAAAVSQFPPLRALGWCGGAVAGAVMVGLVQQALRPRIAYRPGFVLFFLRVGRPIAVPQDVVEAFFLGQGPAHLPGRRRRKEETVNLVARLAQRATPWQRQEVRPALGSWCDGYVTIRGTWSEPLNLELVGRLNRRLSEVSRRRQPEPTEGAATG